MDDLISRKDLMKKIAHHTVHDSMSCVTFERSTVYEMVKGDMFGLVKDAPAVDAMPRWISVEERLPEEKEDVAAVIRYNENVWEYGVAFRMDESWRMNGVGRVVVTHWMPLPSTEGLHDN